MMQKNQPCWDPSIRGSVFKVSKHRDGDWYQYHPAVRDCRESYTVWLFGLDARNLRSFIHHGAFLFMHSFRHRDKKGRDDIEISTDNKNRLEVKRECLSTIAEQTNSFWPRE